ncbi:response regulator [Glaciimonas immobilis]|uniref:CheY-like chemotaxis protein n=1 Tax=Glaciimonas immobilis TaxID=728004 RepID=A0A840RTP6_9BURK|nr:response regulator [Glaciimonas immobilis]KAF3997109.1 response regulator [Glaciimonas immobilis]MBB5199971.1 CheY-like chemotaxis protein [Glaciimonas immobilis]
MSYFIQTAIPVCNVIHQQSNPYGQVPPDAIFTERKSRFSVLVVDDHAINLFSIKRQLEALDCDVVEASDGDAALALIAKRSFSLILLDCYMPGKDGYQIAQEVRKAESKGRHRTPLVAISAATDAHHLQRCVDAGMSAVLKKPLRSEDLNALIIKIKRTDKRRLKKPDLRCATMETFRISGRAARAEIIMGHTTRDFSEMAKSEVGSVLHNCTDVMSSPISANPVTENNAIDPQIIALFRASVKHDLDRIGQALASNDHALIAARVHRLKGAAMVLRISMIVVAIEKFENFLQIDQGPHLIYRYQAYRRLRAEIARGWKKLALTAGG